MKFLYFFGIIIFFFSCNEKKDVEKIRNKDLEELIDVKYAKGFSIKKYSNYIVITLNDAWKGENTSYQYVLYKDKIPEGFNDVLKVKIPITKIACMSLTHIAFIAALEKENTIVAASGINYSHNKKLVNRYKNKEVVEIGSEQSINYELLVEKSPDIVMAYGIDQHSLQYLNKFKKMGLNTILNAEYMETSPLGKAEWIKFVAAFYDKLELADSLFNNIENEYLALTSLTDTILNKPTVFVGMPWNGNWYVAGGKSFQAQLLKDAGADYLWKDNNEKSSVVKSKEVVFNEAYNADFWLNQNNYQSIQAILDYDERLSGFTSVKNTFLYNNSRRLNEFGGNDYWESATINPHIVLKDLIEIFHPNLLNHQLYYYKKLK